jgi:hypothetical protein
MVEAVESLVAKGIAVVIAAGNDAKNACFTVPAAGELNTY